MKRNHNKNQTDAVSRQLAADAGRGGRHLFRRIAFTVAAVAAVLLLAGGDAMAGSGGRVVLRGDAHGGVRSTYSSQTFGGRSYGHASGYRSGGRYHGSSGVDFHVGRRHSHASSGFDFGIAVGSGGKVSYRIGYRGGVHVPIYRERSYGYLRDTVVRQSCGCIGEHAQRCVYYQPRTRIIAEYDGGVVTYPRRRTIIVGPLGADDRRPPTVATTRGDVLVGGDDGYRNDRDAEQEWRQRNAAAAIDPTRPTVIRGSDSPAAAKVELTDAGMATVEARQPAEVRVIRQTQADERRGDDASAVGGGWSVLRQGRVQLAKRTFARDAQRRPNHGPTRAGFAVAAAMAGDDAIALTVMRRTFTEDLTSMERFRTPTSLHEQIDGLITAEQRELKPADYQAEADADPAIGDRHFMIGALYYLRGEHGLALDYAKKALNVDARDRAAANLKALARGA